MTLDQTFGFDTNPDWLAINFWKKPARQRPDRTALALRPDRRVLAAGQEHRG